VVSLLSDQVSTTRLLVLLLFMQIFARRGHAFSSDASHAQSLNPQAGGGHGRAGGGGAPPAEVLQQMVAKTDGVPLFVEELTKWWWNRGWSKNGRRYELTDPLYGIPATLHDSLMAGYGWDAKQVVQLGAVVGRFTYELSGCLTGGRDAAASTLPVKGELLTRAAAAGKIS
jgi:hypothetical protein